MPCLVDTNVILDIFNDDRDWFDWSSARLEELQDRGEKLLVNPVIFCELGVWFDRQKDLENSLHEITPHYEEIPKTGLFLAGKAFLKYRQRTGVKKSTLPDFFIGGHAQAMNYPILTRDIKRYQAYFPKVTLISP
jgi:hypothetical protein